MNELERALEAMKQETVDAATLDAARARVREQIVNAAAAGCAEFRPELREYLSGRVAGSRRVLLEDHLSRCAACRTTLAEMKGERRVIAMPQRTSSRWRRWSALAAAAALVLSVAYLGRGTIDAWMAPGGPRATVLSASGGLYALSGGPLAAGAAIGEKDRIRTAAGAHAVLRLADGSTVDVNERTELYVTAAWSGQAIHLQRGDVIVQAAKQRRGHLRVLTRDSIASVKGTVFAVSSGMAGSLVSVVEGSVEVDQPGRELLLKPGQQAASNPALASSVADAVSWSPDAAEYLQILASFVKIEHQMAGVSSPLRTSSTLLSYLPAGAFVYGAAPNPGGQIGQGLLAAEQQAMENTAFRTWWNSETGLELRQIIDRVHSVSSMLGDEVVFSVASAGPGEEVPMGIAAVKPESRAALASALNGLFEDTADGPQSYTVANDLLVISDSPTHLTWAVNHLGQGAGSPFAAAISDRYQRGAGWLIGVDASPVVQMASEDDAPPIEFAGMVGVKYLFFEQRSQGGADENEVTLTFDDARHGMASWLADGGSGGAAEYLPADVIAAGYVSMREPGQLFQEFTALMTKPVLPQDSFESHLNELEEKLGQGFVANLTAALGTEAAFAVQGLSTTGPTWMLAALANDPVQIDGSIAKLVDTFNAELGPDQQDQRCTLVQESAGGRTWHTLHAAELPFGVTWTYDGGYLVAASDRATAERAIATRYGGTALVWSSTFQGQFPASAAMHPSAFAWLNTKGALALFSALAPGQPANSVLAERDPVLVVFDGRPSQIHAASRTRLMGVIVDAMLLDSMSRTVTGTSTEGAPH
ncbi:MAG TPA: FecR domain-containing protein [Vicinamibacterales bacterium]|nr:FecR domain-containing protein [Vicinamibacterales bacterium]